MNYWNRLTTRQKKGFNFESLVDKKILNWNFEWDPRRGKGADFKKNIDNKRIEIEAKFSHARIRPSWIKRDWLTRFSEDADVKAVVLNRGMKLSKKCLRLIKENQIVLVYFDQLKDFILHVFDKMGFLWKGMGVTRLDVISSRFDDGTSDIDVISDVVGNVERVRIESRNLDKTNVKSLELKVAGNNKTTTREDTEMTQGAMTLGFRGSQKASTDHSENTSDLF